MATIAFVSLPPKTFLGINSISLTTSAKFYGVTDLPPGQTLVYTGTDASLSIRHGTWLTIPSQTESQPRLYVLKWNHEDEQLQLLPNDEDEAQKARETIPDLQRGLINYSALRERSNSANSEQDTDTDEDTTTDQWPILTAHMTPRLLTRTLGPSRSLTSLSSTTQDASTDTIPGLSQSEVLSQLADHNTLNFSSIDLKHTWSTEAIGRARTNMARDRSWYLSHLIAELQQSDKKNGVNTTQSQAASAMLGELQLCFVAVLTLSNYSCLEQWKRLLSVFLTCITALKEVEGFFVELVKILSLQLRRVEDVEGGLFDLADEDGSAWLRKLWRGFKSIVEEVGAELVKVEIHKLDSWMEERYGWNEERGVRKGMVQLEDGEEVESVDERWDSEDEEGEYAPVVVEM